MSDETEKKWTPAQQSAIEHEGGDLLLSAAAGSGKTATLTARLIRLLCTEEGDALPSEVLAVTFTNAASAEMRSRLYDAAAKEVARCPSNAKARRLLSAIDTVQICTMHSFCLSAIRPNFAALGLPSDFRVADETESEMLRKSAMSETVAAFFDNGAADAEFVALCDVLSAARDETSLEKSLLSVASSLANKGIDSNELSAYAEKLENGAQEDFFLSPISDPAREKLADFASHYENLFAYYADFLTANDSLTKSYYPECDRLRGFCAALGHAVRRRSFSGTSDLAKSLTFDRLSPVKSDKQTDESLQFKEHRDNFKTEWNALKSAFLVFTPEDIAASMSRTAVIERALAKVIADFGERFAQKKRDRGAVDFTDIEKMTKKLLVDENGDPTAEAQRIAAGYRYIFIDEYQDTNATQDEIFRAISTDAKRFIVGDIKQSIYGFRGAQPSVFADLRRKFSEDPAAGSYIFMSENFRSAENVLTFANAVSDRMFLCSDVPYDSGDRLRFARKVAEAPTPCELVLIPTRSDDEDVPADEWEDSAELISEPDYIAQRIRTLIRTGRKPDGSPITPGDCAILLRSANAKGDDYAAALAKLGIRSNKSAKSGAFADSVTLSALCILNAIANPELDIYLAGAMKTKVFGFSLDETVKIRLDHPDMPLISSVIAYSEGDSVLAEKCAAFVEKLRELREYSTILPADAFIRSLIRSLGLEKNLADDGIAVSEVRARLRALRNIAKNAENSGFSTLVDFLRFAERMMERDSSATSAPEPSDDAVNIMSIHHSKGLEFPVCFLASASSKFNLRDLSANLLLDPKIGIACRLPDESGLVRCDNILRRCAAASAEAAAVEEEMRVLYVAMTRARERLIVTATVKDPENTVRATRDAAVFDSKYAVLAARNYLGWLLPPLVTEDAPFAKVLVPGEESTEIGGTVITGAPIATTAENAPRRSTAIDWHELLAARFDFEYPHTYLEKIPAKLTVSRLYPEVLDEEAVPADTSFEAFADEAPLPDFMKKDRRPSPTEIGTATHVFMQFCDFDRLASDGASSELDRLVRDRFISDRAAALVDLEQIEQFRCSDLFAKIRYAKRLFREFRFNSSRPAARFTADADLARKLDESGTDVIVQGVVDLLMEDADGNLVLVDYKTDRFTAAQKDDPALCEQILRDRHSTQLSYYREICGEMMGRAIDECLVYSLALGRSVSI